MILIILLFLPFILTQLNSIKDVSLKFTDSFMGGNEWYLEGFIQVFNDLENIFVREERTNKPLMIPLSTEKTINRHAYLTD